jgi:hypothetical protein
MKPVHSDLVPIVTVKLKSSVIVNQPVLSVEICCGFLGPIVQALVKDLQSVPSVVIMPILMTMTGNEAIVTPFRDGFEPPLVVAGQSNWAVYLQIRNISENSVWFESGYSWN